MDDDSQCHASNLLVAREPSHTPFEILTSDKYVSTEHCTYLTEFQQNLYFMVSVPGTAALEPALIVISPLCLLRPEVHIRLDY